ncbi:hypothetical protein NDU88_003417 [Pleurodeles waltl]|uniref:Uncharacterized protein n=1 Tax=Pleurodeles waltl TaxID=8319 RepID=A0AAV7KWG4_PLEWA|nr:hypothetical protein NDU88_003417 [Pleurodeles waltl]
MRHSAESGRLTSLRGIPGPSSCDSPSSGCHFILLTMACKARALGPNLITPGQDGPPHPVQGVTGGGPEFRGDVAAELQHQGEYWFWVIAEWKDCRWGIFATVPPGPLSSMDASEHTEVVLVVDSTGTKQKGLLGPLAPRATRVGGGVLPGCCGPLGSVASPVAAVGLGTRQSAAGTTHLGFRLKPLGPGQWQ